MADDTAAASSAAAENPTPPPTSATGDPPRRPSKPGTKRLLLTLSVLLSFLAGLPFFLKSTEIHRSPLPSNSIASLSRRLQSDPPSSPCRFQAVFLRSRFDPPDVSLADRVQLAISQEVRRRKTAGSPVDPSCGGCGGEFGVSVTVDSGTSCARSRSGGGGAAGSCLWRCGEVGLDELAAGGDEAMDELLDSLLNGRKGECLGSAGGRVYTVVVSEHGGDGQAARVVVGKHRHAWILGKVSEDEVISIIGRVFVKFFMNGGMDDGEMAAGRGEFMPVGSDGSAVLSFSLLNADPTDWVYDWEFQTMGEAMLAPIVESLAPIASIRVESQVLYHAPMSSISHWDGKSRSHKLSTGDLPFFVNSNEWHLDTSISTTGRSKVSQFVVYVPSARECPLYLELPDGGVSKTNAFISPMWGGVVVWNPPRCYTDPEKAHTSKSTIAPQDLKKLLEIFIGQLRQLFGVKSNHAEHNEDGIYKFMVSEKGFAEWELDALYRQHACFNLLSCLTTLESLSSLVQSLPRMVVMDEISKQVKLSLEAADLAQRNASLGLNDASAVSSRKARALAEDAFFHPSIMSISYSSIEHYFAIYMPFFAPVSLHVLLAAVKELRRYKTERAKYLSFLAEQAKSS